MTAGTVREDQYATKSVRAAHGTELDALAQLRGALAAESELVILFNDSVKGDDVRKLVEFGQSLGNPVKYCPLLDYSNSRGAIDMGLVPELLPGYQASGAAGLTVREMLAANDLDAVWMVGANPLKEGPLGIAEGVRRRTGHVPDGNRRSAPTLFCRRERIRKERDRYQCLRRSAASEARRSTIGAKPDLEIIGLIAKEMGLAPQMGPWLPETVYNEIRRTVKGYDIPLPLVTVGAQQTTPVNGSVGVESRPDLIWSAHDNLFTSGTLGRYSKILNSVIEKRLTHCASG